MTSAVVVEALSAADLPHNVALSNSVGWPDPESDWRVIHQAALVLGIKRDGVLIGQGALGLFEGCASIAKMVVAPSAQRQGLGGAILDALLAEAERRALARVGLVATPLGRPLYESRGFEPVTEIAILVGTPRLSDEASATAPSADLERLLELEQRFTGSVRTAVLEGRFRDASAVAIGEDGFALATSQPNGSRVGPIFAADEQAARALSTELFRQLRGPVHLDVPSERRGFRDWLTSLGLIEKGVHLEMSRGGALPWNVPQRFGQATQAWG